MYCDNYFLPKIDGTLRTFGAVIKIICDFPSNYCKLPQTVVQKWKIWYNVDNDKFALVFKEENEN